MSNENTEFNLDSLLDGTLDDLANVPGFENFHPGSHKFTINWKLPKKEQGKEFKPVIKLQLTLIETVELNDASDTPQTPGTMSSIQFAMDNEYGQTAYRAVIEQLGQHYGAGTNREIMEKSEGAECLGITKLREGKKIEGKPTPIFLQLEAISVM